MYQFRGARNFVITGGSFRQDQVEIYQGGKDIGLNILRQHIAADAIYNSAERFPPPKCHPGTREKIIQAIMKWINDPASDQNALWLYGPAGAGKSAIAQSISVLLQEPEVDSEDINYAASFLFARDVTGRGEGTKLFATIAFQLALKYPSVRSFVDAAMINDPILPTKSLDVQLRYLIVEPLLQATEWPAHNPTVIIDGLDECSGSKLIQSEILSLISQAIIEHHVPLKFLIASRPEYWISDIFEIGVLSGVTKRVCLRDDMDTDREIENYLREGFDDIYTKNIRIMSSVQRPWPVDHVIRRFVAEASGQFVYPSTVLKFVGDSSNFCDPRKQLHILTTAGPHRASAFTDLDKLYATILSAYPRQSTLKLVLGGILVGISEKIIEKFLGVEAGEIQLVLSSLSSLIKISKLEYEEELSMLEPAFGSPLVQSDISFCHLSVREFLGDGSRSGQYVIDDEEICKRLMGSIFELGIDIMLEKSGSERIIERIGLSSYRTFVEKTEYLCQMTPPIALISLFQNLDPVLQNLLRRNPLHIPNAHHLIWFIDALLLVIVIRTKPFHIDKDNRKFMNSMDDNLRMARMICVKQILQTQLKDTPTFTYLASYSMPDQNEQVYSAANISYTMHVSYDSVLSDIRCHSDLIYLRATNGRKSLSFGTPVDLFNVTLYEVENEDRHVTEWNHRRTSISARYFVEIFHTPRLPNILWEPTVDQACYYLDCGRLSDIHTKEYFEDPDKMTIFNILMDPLLWNDELKLMEIELATRTLCWFNRQITVHKAVVMKYDDSLPQNMMAIMRIIFYDIYLPHFKQPFNSNLWMSRDDTLRRYDNSGPSLISLHIIPSPHNRANTVVEERPLVASDLPEKNIRYAGYFHYNIKIFNQEVVGSTISPSDWYPHLASFLLIGLVKKHYAMLNRGFDFRSGWNKASATCFLPLIQCFPYAYPTQENLNAIRALDYLRTRVSPRDQWRPPFGFSLRAVEFLKKYDHALLSRPEFDRLRNSLLALGACESRRILDNFIGDNFDTDDDEYTTDEEEDFVKTESGWSDL